MHLALLPTRELYGTISQSEQRVIATATDQVTGVDVSATLAHDDRASRDLLARKALHPQAFSLRIAPVAS